MQPHEQMQFHIDAAQQAQVEGRAALIERDELSKAGTLTEARGKELDERFEKAIASARASKAKADQVRATVDLEKELGEYSEARGTHPQVAPGEGAHILGGGGEDTDTTRAARGSQALIQQIGAGSYWNHMLSNDKVKFTPEARAALFQYLHLGERENLPAKESRALSPYRDPDGGFAVTQEFRMEVIRQQRDLVQIRRFARVLQTNAQSVAFPSFKAKVALTSGKAGGTVPVKTVSEVLGKTTFTPKERFGIIKVPIQLVEDQAFPVDRMLAEEIAMEDAETDERSFLTGTGREEAYGVLTAGILGKDATTSASNVPTPEDLMGLPYEMRAVHRQRAAWMVNRQQLAIYRKMRTNEGGVGTGIFLWAISMIAGQPDTLAGFPLLESEFMPTPSATGDTLALFADWSQYWIVERLGLSIQRLDEKYADTNEIGFKYRKRMDAAPVRLEAFVKLKRAA